jgi:ribonuclease R
VEASLARRVERHGPDARARRRERGRARPRREPEVGADAVLRALQGRARPALAVPALLRALDLSPRSRPALRRLLKQLVADGRLERLGARYRLSRSDGLVEGIFTPGGRSGGRVETEDGRVWRVTQFGDGAPGDRVLLQPLAERQGEIIGVLEGRREAWVGVVERRGRMTLVTPWRDSAGIPVFIGPRDRRGARAGELVLVSLSGRVSQPAPRGRRLRAEARPAQGRVIEVLGPPGSPEADYRALVHRRNLPAVFPEAVLEQVARLEPGLRPQHLAGRLDLRDRPFLTIDPENARDHDDAVCVERLPGGASRLLVAIADVSHYVAPGSPLDREALRRGNSVYFPDRAIPMLPEALSGDLCSLRPGVDRLVLVVELAVQPSGEAKLRRVAPAVIRSWARLVYDEAARVMQGGRLGQAGAGELTAQLRELARVAEQLLARRSAAGSIDFDLPSAEIVLGDEAQPVDIVETPRTVAHRAIEEAMLAANRAVAEALDAARIPTLHRNHERPDPPDLEALRELLEGLGLLPPGAMREISPAEIARALRGVAGRPEERLVHQVALRSMRQARYEVEVRGHFALAFRHYAHFTSPIRRYADLVVHRSVKTMLGLGGENPEPAWLRAAAARLSWRERVAMEAEREMVEIKKCVFLAAHLGETHAGTVSGVARHGLYVTLSTFFAEGLVHSSRLPGRFELDERAHSLVARGSRRRFRLGDRLRVRIETSDPLRGRIDFSLA